METPLFAPDFKQLELCAAKDRDLHMKLRPMLESLHRGAPSSLMTPDHTTRTVTLNARRL